MADLMEVEVPVFGKMVVPVGTNPDELLGALGAQYGVDINKPITPMQAISRGIERGVTGTTRGVGQVMTKVSGQERVAPGEDIQVDPAGNVISGGTAPSVQEQRTKQSVADTDIRKELEYELGKLQGHSGAAMTGYAIGTVLDPANFIGGLGSATVKSLIAEGVITGGVQGFFDPNYSDDTWGNRAISAGMGATGGGVLGGVFGKVFKKLGWIEGEGAKAAGKVTEDVTGSVVGDTGKVMDEGIPTPKTETKAAETAPTTETKVEGTTTVTDPYTAKFDPKVQGSPKPRLGQYELDFESDLDKALYIIGNRKTLSKADQKFIDWIKEVTGITDENVIKEAAAKLKKLKNVEVDKQNNRAFIARSDLPELLPTIKQETAPFVGTAGKLDAGINVNTNTWNALDNTSKNLYNIGRKLLEFDATGVKPKISAAEQKQAYDVLKGIDPNFKMDDMAGVFKGYAKAMDSLDKIRPEGWEAPSIQAILNNRISHEDFTDLFNAGFFDGCPI